MARKKPAHHELAGELEKSITDILVVNESSLRPYIELFTFSPENIIQQRLGNIFGFFEIKEYSDESSYVVNFLTSVLKKEYFSHARRPAPESFELALHKVNLALSELANQGNINWISHLDAAIAVIEKGNLHISVTGSGRVLLIREGSITDISEGLAVDNPDPHPMKTFVNISSGRLEAGDRIIITSDDIFNIFSLDELLRSSNQFPPEKFLQFLRTALVNELEIAGTLVIDVRQADARETIPATQPKENSDDLNAFSSITYQKKRRRNRREEAEMSPRSPEKSSGAENYVDEGTGHIYVQAEDTVSGAPVGKVGSMWFLAKEHAIEILARFRDWGKSVGASLAKKTWVGAKSISIAAFNALRAGLKNLSSRAFKSNAVVDHTTAESTGSAPTFIPSDRNELLKNRHEQSTNRLSARVVSAGFRISQSLLPHASRIRKSFSGLSYQQKLVAIGAVLAIVFIPLIVMRSSGKPVAQPVAVPMVSPEPTMREKLVNEKNIRFDVPIETIYSGTDIIGAFSYGGEVYAVEKRKVVRVSSREEYSLPSQFASSRVVSFMNDLNLALILTERNEIVSYSPISRTFSANTISIPPNADIASIGTYLTYLYVLDRANNQIWRYPRAEGGFGAASPWLKESVSLSGATSMTLDDNIYVATTDGSVMKFFKGKREPFTLEQSVTPIRADFIFTAPDIDNVYAIDTDSSRLVVFGKSGTITSQTYNELFSSTDLFFVDNIPNRILFKTKSEIYSLLTP